MPERKKRRMAGYTPAFSPYKIIGDDLMNERRNIFYSFSRGLTQIELKNVFSKTIRKFGKEKARDLFYWCTDYLVSSISDDLGYGKSTLWCKTIKPLEVKEVTCDKCGNHLCAKNRTNLRCKNLFCIHCSKKEKNEEYFVSKYTIEELKNMPYKEYLKTDHWNNMRRRTYAIQGRYCALCGSGEQTQVHHKTYVNRGEEKNRDLIILCKKCHAKFHDKL